MPITSLRATVPKMRARRPRSQGTPRQSHGWRCARPERGARRATGNHVHSSREPTVPKMRARRPRSQGGRCRFHGWRCARPRARSPQGDGEPCLLPASAQRSQDAGGDARAPRGASPIPRLERRSSPSAEPGGRRGTMYIPAVNQRSPRCGRDARAPRGDAADPTGGDALVPERGARRATGSHVHPSREPTVPKMRARTPAPPGSPRQSHGWRCARPRARSP
jgi:hypothetical protein